jgi:hypothetical protein
MFDLAPMPKGMITKGAIKKRSSIEPSGAWLVDANQARIAQMSAPARALGRSLVLAIANCFIILIFLLRQKYQNKLAFVKKHLRNKLVDWTLLVSLTRGPAT